MFHTFMALATWLCSTSYSTTLKPSLANIMAQLFPMRPEPTIPIFSFLICAMAALGGCAAMLGGGAVRGLTPGEEFS